MLGILVLRVFNLLQELGSPEILYSLDRVYTRLGVCLVHSHTVSGVWRLEWLKGRGAHFRLGGSTRDKSAHWLEVLGGSSLRKAFRVPLRKGKP